MFEQIASKVLIFNIKVLKLLLIYKKAVIRFFLIICWIFIYNNSMLTFDRIIIFIFLIIIILVYKIIYNYLEGIYQGLRDEASYYVVRRQYEPYIHYLHKIIYILFFLQKWRNPFLVFLLYTDKKIFSVMRFVYEFCRSKGFNQEIREIFYMSIIYICYLGTIKVLFGRFYLMLGKWSKLSFIDILFNRIYGLLISILIFSDLINILKMFIITNGLLGCLIIYFSISLILISIELFYIFNKYPDNTKYSGKFMLLIRNSLYTYLTIDLTIYHRMHYTILGRIITIISEIILDLEEDEARFLPNAVVGSYNACIRLKKGFYITLKHRDRYKLKYIDHISSHFLTKCNYLETTFLTYWEFLKRNYYKNIILIQDRKNYPSAYLYHSITSSFMATFGPGMQLTEIYYYKLKCLENHLLLNEKETLFLVSLYNFDLLRLKIIFYMLWDILEIIDFDNKNWIQEFGFEGKTLLKRQDWNIFEINKTPKGFTIIELKKEIYQMYLVLHFFKKELKFYDIENNLDYFSKLFDYLGYFKTDYAYEDADFEYKEMCGRYYISQELEVYSEGLLYLWKNFNIDMGFSRKEDLILSNKYENLIELKFKNVVSYFKIEWELLKEKVKMRYNRL